MRNAQKLAAAESAQKSAASETPAQKVAQTRRDTHNVYTERKGKKIISHNDNTHPTPHNPYLAPPPGRPRPQRRREDPLPLPCSPNPSPREVGAGFGAEVGSHRLQLSLGGGEAGGDGGGIRLAERGEEAPEAVRHDAGRVVLESLLGSLVGVPAEVGVLRSTAVVFSRKG